MKTIAAVTLLIILLYGCSPSHQLAKTARKDILKQPAFTNAHVGISIFEPATGKYWYNYQGNKYFVPASNTKIPTCYAAMKHLGQYLPGIRYATTDEYIYIQPTGDPTLLHPDFSNQRVYDFLRNTDKQIVLSLAPWQEARWGSGWAWNDYSEDYMAERSAMPIYGNVVRFSNASPSLNIIPHYFSAFTMSSSNNGRASVQRKIASNEFSITGNIAKNDIIATPFYTENSHIIYQLLADTLHKTIQQYTSDKPVRYTAIIHSQPTDSLLRIMMHRSDNFFAEQSLLMVSDALLGVMSDEKIIDTLLKTDFKDLPQKPRWVDGSGLSRYDLFSPQDFVTIFNKMKNDFGMDRIKGILATGNTGTLHNYYKADSGYIYAKTGSLSGVLSLSGFLYTRKNKLLIFSVLVNNHQSSATTIRRSVEQFLESIRNRY